MKKIFFILTAALFQTLLFAEADYVVKSVNGKVQYEVSSGNWKKVSAGQELSAKTVIDTSLNSNVVLKGKNGDVTIKSMQKGSIQELTSNVAKAGSLKKNKGLNKAGIAGASGSGGKGVATASSRASEAKADFDWDE